MRKIIVVAIAAVLFAIPTFCLTSCGSDDDEAGGGSAPKSAGVIDSGSGLRLGGYGDYSYRYDNDGRLSEISGRYQSYSFSYNPNKITSYSDGEADGEEYALSYNGSGYISRILYTDTGEEDDEKWTDTGDYSFSYDGNGHLTKISSTYKETGTDENGQYTGTDNSTITFTWNSNRMTRIAWVEKETDRDGTDTYTESSTFDYDDAYENTFRQWTPSLTHNIMSGELEELLAFVGFFGAGPVELPSSGTNSWSESDGSDGSNSYSYRYSYNSIGAVSTTYINGSSYSFSYGYADSDNDAKTRSSVGIQSQAVGSKVKRHPLFSHRHKSHK